MPTLEPRHVWSASLIGLLCVAWLIGCPFSRSSRITPQKLHGTWRSSAADGDLFLAFAPDGTVRFRAIPASAWLRFFGGSLEVRGHWQLKGNELTIEYAETPANLVWLGENWRGQSVALRIQRLTDTELQFVAGDAYQKSLLPPE